MSDKMDFRVGDVVCDLIYGDGIIESIEEEGISPWRVTVSFELFKVNYNKSGHASSMDKHPSLRHGTWEQNFGSLPNIKHVRKVKRWVNLYPDCDKSGFQSGDTFFTANEAKLSATSQAVAVAVEIEVDE